MNEVVGAQLFHGYGVGREVEVRLTHLQFADDNIIIGDKSWMNVRTMRAVLLLFEDVSGLKVNFNKSMLIGDRLLASELKMNRSNKIYKFVSTGTVLGICVGCIIAKTNILVL
jgi:hypothetical protein